MEITEVRVKSLPEGAESFPLLFLPSLPLKPQKALWAKVPPAFGTMKHSSHQMLSSPVR